MTLTTQGFTLNSSTHFETMTNGQRGGLQNSGLRLVAFRTLIKQKRLKRVMTDAANDRGCCSSVPAVPAILTLLILIIFSLIPLKRWNSWNAGTNTQSEGNTAVQSPSSLAGFKEVNF